MHHQNGDCCARSRTLLSSIQRNRGKNTANEKRDGMKGARQNVVVSQLRILYNVLMVTCDDHRMAYFGHQHISLKVLLWYSPQNIQFPTYFFHAHWLSTDMIVLHLSKPKHKKNSSYSDIRIKLDVTLARIIYVFDIFCILSASEFQPNKIFSTLRMTIETNDEKTSIPF